MITPDDLDTPESEPLSNRQQTTRRTTTRGRPCPKVTQGTRCGGDSEVLNVRQQDAAGVRYRRCLSCGHRWRTKEIDDE